jgi:hypothetical protein
LRLEAEALVGSQNWLGLVSIGQQLETADPAMWPHLWGPAVAVAYRQSGAGDGRDVLDRAIDAGFRQPDFLADLLSEAFGQDADWDSLVARMTASVLPPPVEIMTWPTRIRGPQLILDRLAPSREQLLLERLPARTTSAWETARRLLHWTNSRWEHANDHVEHKDAVHVLDRVDGGERFACVEYSIVLSQSLNAVGIPARTVELRMRDYHTGFGRSHVVSEAWIDDLGWWILLDGQNNAWWGDDPDSPLGVRQLQARHHAGEPRPRMWGVDPEIPKEDQDFYWRYFCVASSTGVSWATPPFTPIFQGEPRTSELLVTAAEITHPDLSQVDTAVLDDNGVALAFTPCHPFATGLLINGHALELEEAFVLSRLAPGTHELPVSVATRYNNLPPQPLVVTIR